MESTRLPGKVLLPIGDKSILEWTVTRSKEAELADKVVVAVGDNDLNEGITAWCDRLDFEYIVGPEEHLLDRHLKVAETTGADTIVRIAADCPFIPPDEIDRLIHQHEKTNSCYTTNLADEMPRGTIIDVVDSTVLSDLSGDGETHPVTQLRKNLQTCDVQYSTDPKWADISGASLEINTSDEYYAVTDAFEAVGPDAYSMGEWLIKNR